MSEYRLNTLGIQAIIVAGIGGTGGFLAEGLCRMLTGNTQIQLRLTDPDRVEEGNLLRQNFLPEEVGEYKSEALAKRLAREFRRPISFSTGPFDGRMRSWGENTLLIGCVDNAAARRALHHASGKRDAWLMDCGNGSDWGQVLIGNAEKGGNRGSYPIQMRPSFSREEGLCYKLPLPGQQMPELLQDAPVAEESPDRGCAEALLLQEQSPAINPVMASIALDLVKQMLLGKCTTMGLYLDLGRGTMRPARATPEKAAQIWETTVEELT